MPDPKSRDIIGKAMLGKREQWYVQGHIGSTWQNEQYVRSRDMKYVKPAFEDLLERFQTDYVHSQIIEEDGQRKVIVHFEHPTENGFG